MRYRSVLSSPLLLARSTSIPTSAPKPASSVHPTIAELDGARNVPTGRGKKRIRWRSGDTNRRGSSRLLEKEEGGGGEGRGERIERRIFNVQYDE